MKEFNAKLFDCGSIGLRPGTHEIVDSGNANTVGAVTYSPASRLHYTR